MQNDGRNDSMRDVLSGLFRNIGTLARAEVDLATTEMSGKAFRIGKDAGLVAGGTAMAYAGTLAIMAAMVRILESVFPRWFAAFVVGLIFTGGGAFLARKGLEGMKQTELAPEQTIRTIKKLTD
jgi:hypothetical protein